MYFTDIQPYLRQKAQLLPINERDFFFRNILNGRKLYPFNIYTDAFVYLVDRGILSWEKYEKIKRAYEAFNINLHLFELDNTAFGGWGEQYLRDVNSNIKPIEKGNKNNRGKRRYDNYLRIEHSEYKLESKTSRAINRGKVQGGNLVENAAFFNTGENYTTDLDHLKLDHADVFVLTVVWVDLMKHWVIPSGDLDGMKHVGRKEVNGLGRHISIQPSNITFFRRYQTDREGLYDKIKDACKGIVRVTYEDENLYTYW